MRQPQLRRLLLKGLGSLIRGGDADPSEIVDLSRKGTSSRQTSSVTSISSSSPSPTSEATEMDISPREGDGQAKPASSCFPASEEATSVDLLTGKEGAALLAVLGITEQPPGLLREMVVNILSFCKFENMLAASTACRFFQLASRQPGSCFSIELTTKDGLNKLLGYPTERLRNLLHRRARWVRRLILTPEGRIDQLAENHIPVLLRRFQMLNILELNSSVPYLAEELEEVFSSNHRSLQFIDLSAGFLGISAMFPGVDFNNLIYLRACDDWWKVDFRRGFKCDNLMYLGVRPLPKMRHLPETWKEWLMRLRHLRRLIVLVDAEDDDHDGGEGDNDQDDPMQQDDTHTTATTTGSSSSTARERESSFSIDLLRVLEPTLPNLVELRLLDYSAGGGQRSLQHLLARMEARRLPMLKELSVATTWEPHKERLSKLGFDRDGNAEGWEDTPVFRRREEEPRPVSAPN
ncbi:unnamed protein product [Vitrella brassicaformis CCMP3155]|uniref:F-box domain-containing protein n=2 Tax=Vitrella brassicaformis TaxID=1169539 RepID=A0A0G4FWY2_VITBC|nr:unnamed protein product [Vitrella brassicaformis CCMP3155]|eukprot:CEM19812.1 unnamed protein product [Vitrella brassicaformis CCMP3155]